MYIIHHVPGNITRLLSASNKQVTYFVNVVTECTVLDRLLVRQPQSHFSQLVYNVCVVLSMLKYFCHLNPEFP